jgi:5'-nucleotidase
MRIFIDMDGVICDYKGTYAIMRKLVPALRFPQSGTEFWTSLKPIDGAIEAVNKLREVHDVFILSAPSVRNPASYSGKRMWIQDYFGKDFVDRLILCNYKGLVKGDILIDDNLTGKGQEDFEGRQIHFGHSPYLTWNEVLEEIL